jgi:hypothetical protein
MFIFDTVREIDRGKFCDTEMCWLLRGVYPKNTVTFDLRRRLYVINVGEDVIITLTGLLEV